MSKGKIARGIGILVLAGALLAGCSKHDRAPGSAEESVSVPEVPMANIVSVPPPAPIAGPAGSGAGSGGPDLGVLLAYEHDVTIRVASDRIVAQSSAVQSACNSGKFGACAVLEMSQSGGDTPMARLKVRIVPEGVDKLIGLAGKGEDIAEHSIQAADLATEVRDNSMLQDRLRKEHARLLEFQDRKDLKVADVMTLSSRIAEIEAQLQAAEQEAAQQKRRLSTQLVTMTFQTTRIQENRSEIAQATEDIGGVISGSIAFLIRAFAALLPVAVVLFLLVFLIRRIRRARRKS